MKSNIPFFPYITVFVCISALFLFLSGNVEATAREIDSLRSIFQETVSHLQVTDPIYLSWMRQEVIKSFAEDVESHLAHIPQYFVFVDRNPAKQLIMVGFYHPIGDIVDVVGWDHTSTGEPSRPGHFITPTGVYEHSTSIIGYRARGIRNESGWLGIGVEGSRVWDFGWQATPHTKGGQTWTANIRLHLHATDPEFGEARLGRPDSKGCVRVSGAMNRFLDHFGILDADYEDNPHIASWLLDPQRETVSHPGRFMIVADSKFMKQATEYIEYANVQDEP